MPGLRSIEPSRPLPSKTARMACSGRTQRNMLLATRMLFGHGIFRMASAISDGRTSFVSTPAFSTTANQTAPFGVSRFSHWSRLSSPALFRKPAMACSGAPTFGPFFSSRKSGCRSGRPSTDSARRRGVAKDRAWSKERLASFNPSQTRRCKSAAAFFCIRAGISSENSSSRRSGIRHAPALSGSFRRKPSPTPGPARYRPAVRSPKSRRAHPAD